MFCSSECRDSAVARYHRFECPIIEKLLSHGSVHMAVRLFFIALTIFGDSIEGLKSFVEENQDKLCTIFDFNMKSLESGKDKSLLMALTALTKSSKIFSLHNHEAALKDHPQLKDIWSENEDFIKSFLQRQCQTSDLNYHGIFSGSSKKSTEFNPATVFTNLQQPIGSGSFPFCSLINHSCCNNIIRVYVEGRIVLVVVRPIPKGSQLFDSYK